MSAKVILYPSLDLHDGKVVRLRQGDLARQTVYGDDPLAVARRWIAAGARWLHVVNLDGAFSVANQNEAIIKGLVALGVPIQFGGGLRSAEDVQRAFALGVRRVVLGTLAAEQPDLIGDLIAEHGAESVAVALDARDGLVTTRGWQDSAGITPVELGRKLAALGARHALYTDVNRDGELTGVNVAATVELARQTGLSVIASGGVASLADLRALSESGSVAGAVLGKALYERRIDLAEAQRVVDS